MTNKDEEPCVMLKQKLFDSETFIEETICRNDINNILNEIAKELGINTREVEAEVRKRFIQEIGSIILNQVIERK